MTQNQSPLPHWDMSAYFPAIESEEYQTAFADLMGLVDQIEAMFDEHSVRQSPAGTPNPPTSVFDQVITAWNELSDRFGLLNSFVYSYVSTDASDEVAQAAQSELRNVAVRVRKCWSRLEAWFGHMDLDALAAESQVARDHLFQLEKYKIGAAHQMSEAEEQLAADLQVTGGDAWIKLYNDVTSQLQVRVPLPDGEQVLPMSQVRNLAEHADPVVRQAAYESELKAWEEAAIPLAAALNSIKGHVNTLSTRRRWDDPLDVSLFVSNIDRETLEAMQSACTAAFPDFRRYLQAKAKLLGKEKLPWFDLFAPVGAEQKSWTFEEARDFVVKHFRSYSQKMADFAQRAFEERWIDAEPRNGKRGGAFCMVTRPGESRILMNFSGGFSAISTLAHELGHAYHNLCLQDRTAIQRATPMTLAETASIFCETLVTSAALREADSATQIAILEENLRSTTQIVVDIHSRFLFESRVFEKRRQRELSVSEFNALMLEAQRETYGDGLDPDYLHPYMWAVKGHYYSTGRSYYNYPYTFGLLFGLGLFARYQQDPDGFKQGYDDLLSSTGLYDAATLAKRFDIDVRDVGFWTDSLNIVRRQIDQFVSLASY